MVILVTGGAGSLGRAIINAFNDNDLSDYSLRVLDINESGLAELKSEYPFVRTLYGDISNKNRVDLAMRGVNICIHTAALKNIDITEYNIPELIRINVIGTLNLVCSAMYNNVEHFILVSSDKAVNPTTNYGVTKLLGENIVKWAGRIQNKTGFTIIRPGNFWESSGNVFEIWDRQYKNNEPLTLTDKNMVRYFIDINDLAKFIIENIAQEEFYSKTVIPKMNKYLIYDLLKQKYPDANIKIIGKRPGEKLIEELWSEYEKPNLEEKDNCWLIKW